MNQYKATIKVITKSKLGFDSYEDIKYCYLIEDNIDKIEKHIDSFIKGSKNHTMGDFGLTLQTTTAILESVVMVQPEVALSDVTQTIKSKLK
jgi:hypothetical protein